MYMIAKKSDNPYKLAEIEEIIIKKNEHNQDFNAVIKLNNGEVEKIIVEEIIKDSFKLECNTDAEFISPNGFCISSSYFSHPVYPSINLEFRLDRSGNKKDTPVFVFKQSKEYRKSQIQKQLGEKLKTVTDITSEIHKLKEKMKELE